MATDATFPQEHQKRIRSQYNMRLAELEREREGIEEEKVILTIRIPLTMTLTICITLTRTGPSGSIQTTVAQAEGYHDRAYTGDGEGEVKQDCGQRETGWNHFERNHK